MEKFDVHILGCGSAKPTLRHSPSAQVVNFREKLFMIDCGEGAQVQLLRSRLKVARLSHIFISHLHGDHIFGLIGLLSTLALSGRTSSLHIHAFAQLETLLRPWLDFFCKGMEFEVIFDTIPCDRESHLVYEDRSLSVTTIPLRHRVASCGFLFQEKNMLPHIRRDMIDFLQIPYYAINGIKGGGGWTTPEGDVYPHERLVTPADPARSYAYCSDTAFCPDNAPRLHGVTVLYHEATFGTEFSDRAAETLHSTAAEAGRMARLCEAGRLVIGHYSSRYDDSAPLLLEAQHEFPDTLAANEGMVIHV